MKNFNKKYIVPNTSRGFSLIELMIAMVIGLIVLGSLAYVFLGSQAVNRMLSDTSGMQYSGRNALELMGRTIRQAGSRLDAGGDPVPASLTGTEGASGVADTVTVQYQAQAGGETDCAGVTIGQGLLITAAFAVTANQLTCNNTVVSDNIENMQIQYAVDTSVPTSVAISMASSVGATANGVIGSYQPATGVADFSRVTAVRITLLARGASTNVAANASQTYTYNGVSVTSTDGFLRQVYNSTYTVRNQSR